MKGIVAIKQYTMKKLVLFPFLLLLAFTVSACEGDSPEPEQPGENEEETTEPTPGSNGRCLVVFCSRTGNTRAMAERIRNVLDCDLLEVVPATPYDEDYNSMLARAQREQADIEQGNYPAIRTSVESLDGYETIFIGYPIWYGHMATPVQTFLHNHAGQLSGKRIALFASSGSSGISTSLSEARSLCPDVSFTEPLHLTSATMSQMESRIASWMDELDINTGNNMESNTIKLMAGNHTFTATLAGNSSAGALQDLLAKGDVTIAMSDYANMEKVGPLGTSLPRNDERITTGPGDLILYQGNMFVIYYAPNTYSFTRLGKIENITRDELLSVLGRGDVTVTLSLK